MNEQDPKLKLALRRQDDAGAGPLQHRQGGAARLYGLDQYLDHCALGRTGTHDEVAKVAAFLVSEDSSCVNGETIVIDGAV